jgi:hypothetical protein
LIRFPLSYQKPDPPTLLLRTCLGARVLLSRRSPIPKLSKNHGA